MVLISIFGKGRSVNREVVMFAAKNTPSLLIDCANYANPHAFFPEITQEQLAKVYVMQSDLIYTFRDIMRRLPKLVGDLGVKVVAVTTFDGLFNYQNAEENKEIFLHGWELMKEASMDLEIRVGVLKGGRQIENALSFCDLFEKSKY